MAPVVLDAVQTQEAMEAGSSELKYLFAKERVSEGIQAIFYHSGVTTIARLSAFFKDDDDLRKVVLDSMGLDPNTSLAERTEVAGIICAFRSASTRTEEFAKHTGEMEAKKLQKPLLGSEYLGMRNAYDITFGKIEDYEAPARVYLEKRIADLESGDLRAESLQTVLCREQDGEETLVPQWDSSGTIKLKRSMAEIADPSNPEELRSRLTVMMNGLIMISLQHTNRKELGGFTPTFVHTYASYLLGEHCWLLVARDGNGQTIAAPQWGLVIRYEMAIRKRSYKVMQETGRRLIDCMRESWLDPLTKERAFTTPLAIAAATGHNTVEMSTYGANTTRSSTGNNVLNSHLKSDKGESSKGKGGGRSAKGGGGRRKGQGKKGGGKGSGGGKGNKSGLSIPQGCAARSPDGRSLCYGYNDAAVRCRKADCSFLHVCGRCFQKHPIYACQGNRGTPAGTAPETRGSGGD